jgi:hypothetical protein
VRGEHTHPHANRDEIKLAQKQQAMEMAVLGVASRHTHTLTDQVEQRSQPVEASGGHPGPSKELKPPETSHES